MKLSVRLETVIHMANKGNLAVDVGCDHAFVPIELVSRGISPAALACDVREGPLAAAGEHIREAGLSDRIRTVLADGIPPDLEEILGTLPAPPDSGRTLILAGMGGLLMRSILDRAGSPAVHFGQLILSPQRNAGELREALRMHGYRIADEAFLKEDGKYYPVIMAEAGDGETAGDALIRRSEDLYGPVLLRSGNPVLLEYIEKKGAVLSGIIRQLEGGAVRKEERLAELYREQETTSTALEMIRSSQRR